MAQRLPLIARAACSGGPSRLGKPGCMSSTVPESGPDASRQVTWHAPLSCKGPQSN